MRKYKSTDFEIQQWKPPDKEDRELRTSFYGPITDEMLRKTLAGVDGDTLEPPKKPLLEKKETIQNDKKNDVQAHEFFLTWQDKKVSVPRIGVKLDRDGDGYSVRSNLNPSVHSKSIKSNFSLKSIESSNTVNTTEGAGMRLICFPWVGGNPAIFEKLSAHIPLVHCIGVTYPGRLNRCREKMTDIRSSAHEISDALAQQGLLEAPFSFLGHGLGAIFAYEVAIHLREHYQKQPELMFVIQAKGPQSFVDGEGFDEEVDQEDKTIEEEEPLWEMDDENLYEYVMTLDKGGIHEEADHQTLFPLGLGPLKTDLQILSEFRYRSDWPIARPLYLVIAHYDGRVSRDDMRTWERETTKQLNVHEMLCDGRSMLREDAVIREFGSWLNDRISDELHRKKDPDEDELDQLARGVV